MEAREEQKQATNNKSITNIIIIVYKAVDYLRFEAYTFIHVYAYWCIPAFGEI